MLRESYCVSKQSESIRESVPETDQSLTAPSRSVSAASECRDQRTNRLGRTTTLEPFGETALWTADT